MLALFVVASVFGCCFFTHEFIDDASRFSLKLDSSHCAKQLTCIHFVFNFCHFGLYLKLCCLFFLLSFFVSNDTILVFTSWKGLQWILQFDSDLPSKTCEKLIKFCLVQMHYMSTLRAIAFHFKWSIRRTKRDWKIQVCFFLTKENFYCIEIVDLTKKYSAIVWCTAGFYKKK